MGTQRLGYNHIRCMRREQFVSLTAPTAYTKGKHNAAASQRIPTGGNQRKTLKNKFMAHPVYEGQASSGTRGASTVNQYAFWGGIL